VLSIPVFWEFHQSCIYIYVPKCLPLLQPSWIINLKTLDDIKFHYAQKSCANGDTAPLRVNVKIKQTNFKNRGKIKNFVFFQIFILDWQWYIEKYGIDFLRKYCIVSGKFFLWKNSPKMIIWHTKFVLRFDALVYQNQWFYTLYFLKYCRYIFIYRFLWICAGLDFL
jgi:sensor histidine kinase YesM